MRRIILLLLLLGVCLSAPAQSKADKAIKEVKSILALQKQAWNEGSLEGFMKYYWHSEDLQFISSSGLTKGWQATLERYQQRYPDKAAMGQLEFELLSANMRSKNVVTLSGKYILSRDQKNLVGYFLLVWEKIDKQWVIVMDATN